MRAAEHLPPRWNAAEHFIAHSAARRGAAPAIITDEGVTSYAELEVAVRRAAAALVEAGMHPGDRVVLLLTDGPLLATLFWGVLAAGGIAVPLNPLLRAADIATILGDCAPWLVISGDGTHQGQDQAMLSWTPIEAAARISRATPAATFAPTHRDGFAFMLYSSGTTGEPKGVVHLHHDMWVCARTYGQKVLGIAPSDRCFSVAKLPFAYGLGNAGYFPLDVGAAAVLFAGRPAPEAVFEQVRRHRPTLYFGVPTSYAQLLAAMDAGVSHDFSSVRRCVSAGESLPASLFERWKARTGLEILDGIGSTEICHIFLSGRPGACKPGSTGLPVPGYELRLVDEKGADVPRGAIGDLVVRGDSTMALYWNKADATTRAVSGEWIRTGDKYRIDDDGYYFHAGRSDDMLKVSGQWVSPVEVEAALIEHPAVLECAVVGALDEDGLERPHAFVALRPNASASAEDLIAAARAGGRLASFKIPRKITIIAELPKTVTGKIQRYLLRDR